ncbi:hypothetical protein Tco_1239518 [Tanacetum coccineum]
MASHPIYYEVEDFETKLIKEMSYELLEDDQKKKLGKNNEAKMTLYNPLLHKEYEGIFMCRSANKVWHSLTKAIHKSRIARLIFSLKNMRSSQSPMKKLLIATSRDSTLLLVPSCCVIFDLEPFLVDFVFNSEIFKSFPCLS